MVREPLLTTAAITDLRPTQITVGMREVEAKRRVWKEQDKKKRDEFYAARSNILDTLDKIDREIKDHLPCTTKALKEQENRLYVRIKQCLFLILFIFL